MALATGMYCQAGVPGALRLLEVPVEGGEVGGEKYLRLPLRVVMLGHHGGQRNREC